MKKRKSYIKQMQFALDDAARAIGAKLEISEIKLIERRLETLAPLAELERNKKDLKLRKENEGLKTRVQELEALVASLKPKDTPSTEALQSFDAIVEKVGRRGNQKDT